MTGGNRSAQINREMARIAPNRVASMPNVSNRSARTHLAHDMPWIG
jgi:hypothetical protein